MLKIQAANENDIQTIIQLNMDLIHRYEEIESIDLNMVKKWIENKVQTHIHEYNCVYVDGNKAGYFYFHENEDKMEMDDLYVFEAYQNQKIGTRIIQKCQSETDKPIFLYVFLKNEGAIRLYKRMGFHEIKRMKTRCIMEYTVNREK